MLKKILCSISAIIIFSSTAYAENIIEKIECAPLPSTIIATEGTMIETTKDLCQKTEEPAKECEAEGCCLQERKKSKIVILGDIFPISDIVAEKSRVFSATMSYILFISLRDFRSLRSIKGLRVLRGLQGFRRCRSRPGRSCVDALRSAGFCTEEGSGTF